MNILLTVLRFIQGMIMDKSLQTRIINVRHLCDKNLINDIKEAATCEVRTVCRFVCHHCPCVPELIDVRKLQLAGLSAYIIQLKKEENGELLISITEPNIDNWLIMNNLPLTPKT